MTRSFSHFGIFNQMGKSRKSPIIAIFFARLVHDLVYWCIAYDLADCI